MPTVQRLRVDAPRSSTLIRDQFGANRGVPHVVERLLNHRLGMIKTVTILTDVAEVYNLANYLPEMREAITV